MAATIPKLTQPVIPSMVTMEEAVELLGTAAAAVALIPLGNTTSILMASSLPPELVHLVILVVLLHQTHVEAKVCQKELPL